MTRRRTPPRWGTTAAAAVLAGGVLLGACSDDGDPSAFCDRLGTTPDVADVLSGVDGSDPGGSEAAVREGVSSWRQLEAAAPGEVRADVARVRQGVELVLDAVEDNPDDLPAAREQITSQADELSGLVQAGQRVADYARTECGLELDVGGPGPAATDPTATDSTPASGPEDTDGGGDDGGG